MSNSDAPISFSFAGLGAGYCFTSFDRFALDIVAAMSGYMPGEYSVIIDSETEPVAADRGKLWHKLISGAPSGRIYKFYLGKWVSPNPVEPQGQARIWFEGSEADAWSYDGGDGTDPSGNVPTATTGAMWEFDTNYAFRFPLAAGTSPKPTTVSVGDTGGEEEHAMQLTDLPAALTIPRQKVPDPVHNGLYLSHDTITENDMGVNADVADNYVPGVGTPITNLPPYRVGLWLKRTARIYLVG